jgi:hypothetical protein
MITGQFPKKLYLERKLFQDKKTRAAAGPGNYAIELSAWLQSLISSGVLDVSTANITTGVLTPATNNRVADFAGQTLSMKGTANKTISTGVVGGTVSKVEVLTTGVTLSADQKSELTLNESGVLGLTGKNGSDADFAVYSTNTNNIDSISIDAVKGSTIARLRLLDTGSVIFNSTSQIYRLGDIAANTPLSISDSVATTKFSKLSIDGDTGFLYKAVGTFVFVSDTALVASNGTLASTGSPTASEMQSWVNNAAAFASSLNSYRERFIRYNGTDVSSTETTHLFYVDDNHVVESVNSPSENSANITQGTLVAASANREVDMAAFNLLVSGEGDKTITHTNGNVDNQLIVNNFAAYLRNDNNGVESFTYTGDLGVILSANANTQIQTLVTGEIKLKSNTRTYTIDSTKLPIEYNSSTHSAQLLSVHPSTGTMYLVDTTPYFVSSGATGLTIAVSGEPTAAEIRTYIVANLTGAVQGTIKNRIVYFTGTTTATDAYTHAFYFAGDKSTYLLDKPVANITQGTLVAATGDRVVDLAANDLILKTTTGRVAMQNITSPSIYAEARVQGGRSFLGSYNVSNGNEGSIDLGHTTGIIIRSNNTRVYKLGTGSTSIPTAYTATTLRSALSINPATGQIYATPDVLTYVTGTDPITLTVATEIFNASSGTFTVTLPTAASIAGKKITVKNSGTGDVTVDADGSETIDGSANFLLDTQYDSVTVVSDGTNWFII